MEIFAYMNLQLKARLALGMVTIALLLSDLIPGPYLNAIVAIVIYIFVSYPVLLCAYRDLVKRHRMSEQFLMSIATFGAFALQDYPEALAVMVFYLIGDTFEQYAANRSSQEIAAVVKLKPNKVRLIKEDGTEELVKARKVKIGQRIRVLSGESIGLDGTLVPELGQSADSAVSASIDLSALNGESEPALFTTNDEIPSGGINMGGVIELIVTCDSSNSSINRLINLIEDAVANKSRPEALITRFSVYYTPIVVTCAVLLALVPLVVPNEDFANWLTRALVFLVVSCPCALVLSVPLSFFGGLGALSKTGVMVKGSIHIEALSKLKGIAFDKTGTITHGRFSVLDITLFPKLSPEAGNLPYQPKPALDDESDLAQKQHILEILYALESKTTHPIGVAITNYCKDRVALRDALNVEEITGYGLKGELDGHKVMVGKGQLLTDLLGWKVNASLASSAQLEALGLKSQLVGTDVYILEDGVLLGRVTLADEIKAAAVSMSQELHHLGIKSYMITGDKSSVAQDIAKQAQIDQVYAEQLPSDKLNTFKNIKEQLALKHNNHQNGTLAFVGDGINDAPTLAAADVGIAMGQFGSAAAVEAADVVIMNDDLTKIPRAIDLAKRTYALAKQNMVMVIGVKALILILGALGFANIWLAILGDVGLCVIAVLNAMRPIYWVKQNKSAVL